jgi:hypothetical protein
MRAILVRSRATKPAKAPGAANDGAKIGSGADSMTADAMANGSRSIGMIRAKPRESVNWKVSRKNIACAVPVGTTRTNDAWRVNRGANGALMKEAALAG